MFLCSNGVRRTSRVLMACNVGTSQINRIPGSHISPARYIDIQLYPKEKNQPQIQSYSRIGVGMGFVLNGIRVFIISKTLDHEVTNDLVGPLSNLFLRVLRFQAGG